MKSVIKYFGGKGGMYNKILEHFPSKDTYNIYIEPFAGAYSVGIKLKDVPVEIYNDINKNVYSLFKVLSDKNLFNSFKDKCDLLLYDDTLRKEYKQLLKNKNLSIDDRAFYFFYVNRTSHNGIGGFSYNRSIRRGMSKSISDFLSSVNGLKEFHNRLSKILIMNTDGISLIEKYKNQDNVMIYCDPPYELSTRGDTRYEDDMEYDFQKKFISVVKNSKTKILISGYDCDLYKELEANGFEKIQFEVKTISGSFEKKTKIETLWKNYKCDYEIKLF